VTSIEKEKDLTVNAIMLEEKYKSFPKKDREQIEKTSNLNITDIEIKSPNNPAKLLKAKLIKFIK